MAHIKQKAWAHCALCATGIVTDKTYDDVLSSFAPDSAIHGVWYGEIIHAIYKKRGWLWRVTEYPNVPFREFEVPDRAILYLARIDEPGVDDRWRNHYVAIKDGMFHDPIEDEPFPLEQARQMKYGKWEVLAMFHAG